MAPSVAGESTLHCKLDSQLHRAAVRSTFWVGGKRMILGTQRLVNNR